MEFLKEVFIDLVPFQMAIGLICALAQHSRLQKGDAFWEIKNKEDTWQVGGGVFGLKTHPIGVFLLISSVGFLIIILYLLKKDK
jgi:hypothetical protein